MKSIGLIKAAVALIPPFFPAFRLYLWIGQKRLPGAVIARLSIMKRTPRTVPGPDGATIKLENHEEIAALALILSDHLQRTYPGKKTIPIPEGDQWLYYRANWEDRPTDFMARKLVLNRGRWLLIATNDRNDQTNQALAYMNEVQFMQVADYFMPQQKVVHPDHLPIYNEPATQTDLQPGMYLCLFHGFHNEIDRKRYNMNDMGFGVDGPMIGPFHFVHTTYAQHVKYAFSEGFFDYKNRYGLEKEGDFEMADDCLVYNGVQYGDWSVTNYPFPK